MVVGKKNGMQRDNDSNLQETQLSLSVSLPSQFPEVNYPG